MGLMHTLKKNYFYRITIDFAGLKADPNFEGLKQVINEPEDRVYIGDEPPLFKRVKNDRTKYLNSIKINPVATYSGQQGKWL